MDNSKKTLLLGAHMSIGGGLDKSIIRGASIGCTVIQIFTQSNRQWRAKKLSEEDIANFKTTKENTPSIKTIVAHAPYLINIGSADKTIHDKSVNTLIEQLTNCSLLEIPYLVLHPGSYGSGSENECLDRIAQTLDTVMDKMVKPPMILLEIMAGQGSSVCYNFEQLAYIYHKVHHKSKIGICLDTCHVFAAGYDLRTQDAYEKTWHDFDTILGLKLLKTLHINDSKKDLNTHVDRHANIGKGLIGLDFFKLLFNDHRFFDIPKILETPYETEQDYLKDMMIIESLISSENKKRLLIFIGKN